MSHAVIWPEGKSMRILMWSGPRNLSTAMMRSFGARGDCAVWDEPFYAAYLKRTGLLHPMRDEIIASHDGDPASVASACAKAAPGGEAHFYQKHMTHHMLEGFDLSFMEGAANVFLIRPPERVLASYAAKREEVTLGDIGFTAQAELFDRITDKDGKAPAVIDSGDVTRDPERSLRALCNAIGLPFTARMLSWTPGIHPTDGVWAKHWYNAVENSTGFQRGEEKPVALPDHLQRIADAARPFYDKLAASAGRI
jgi:hypothetical protein